MALILGIDPGKSGAIAMLDRVVDTTSCVKMPATAGELLELLNRADTHAKIDLVVIERQEPRPTFWQKKETKEPMRSILKSTVLLYGGYREILGMLIALGLRVEDIRPQAWQKALGIPPLAGKPGLKRKAEQLFPGGKVTNWNADALLLAEYGRRLIGKTP